MKHSYYELGRKLSLEEYREMIDWRSKNRDEAWTRGDKNEEGLVFYKCGIGYPNGERWITEQESQEFKDHRNANNRAPMTEIPPTDKQKTRFPVDRKLTDEEYRSLCEWKDSHPEEKWLKGNVHPDNPNLIFSKYEKKSKNGETWTRNKNRSDFCTINQSEFKRRDTPIETDKISFFQVGRRLTPEEYKQLTEWRKLNPEKAFKANDKHPIYDVLFHSYSSVSTNGERWCTESQVEKNKTNKRACDKRFKSKNKEKFTEIGRKYRENNKERVRENKRLYMERRMKDPIFNLKQKVRAMIRRAFSVIGESKIASSEEILGCTIEEFKTHIESKFSGWMTWQNRGFSRNIKNPQERWEYDHIIPINCARTVEEVILLSHYLNIQPMCAYENKFVKNGSPPEPEKFSEIINSILIAKQKRSIDKMFERYSQLTEMPVTNTE